MAIPKIDNVEMIIAASINQGTGRFWLPYVQFSIPADGSDVQSGTATGMLRMRWWWVRDQVPLG